MIIPQETVPREAVPREAVPWETTSLLKASKTEGCSYVNASVPEVMMGMPGHLEALSDCKIYRSLSGTPERHAS